ncbi:hypothetical protein [Paraburkholderia sp. J41]|uniref:hypothetical protein n=1 Tax=Paraburkholderia sp. J41 TaxID=2805433 RepID=UPI002AC3421E|nr:hypothetical protein [Paraburkholderia sp. J41]
MLADAASAWPLLAPGSWPTLIAGTLVIALLSLGIHDLAISHLGVPYPKEDAVPVWAKYLGQGVRFAATVALCRAASIYFLGRNAFVAAAIMGGLVAGLYESLRVIGIEWVILDGWRRLNWVYVLTDRAPASILTFYQRAIATFIARRWRSGWNAPVVIAIAATSAFGYFTLSPGLTIAMSRITSALGVAQPVVLYWPPYDLHVYAYIYGLFIESAIFTVALAAISWTGLGDRLSRCVSMFAFLLLLARGRPVALLAFSYWIPARLPVALACEGQFFLETFVLASLSALLWARVRAREVGVP